MVERKVAKEKYIIAGIITSIIFLLGMSLGLVVENKRVDLLDTVYRDEAVRLQSSQLQYEFIQSNIDNESCAFVFDTYHQSLKALDDATVRLESYSTNEKINERQFDILKREFLLTEIRYWLLADEIKKVCDVDMVPILYFHDLKEDCPDCDAQSFILTYLKKKFGQQVLIFSFSVADTNEPMVDLLQYQFDVQQYPTVVVNKNKTDGFATKEILESQICSQLRDSKECD